MASLDPATYLRTVPPFDALPVDLYERAARAVDVVYFPAGRAHRPRRRRAARAPPRHPQGRGPHRARRPDPAAPRGGRALRLHLAPRPARRRSTSSPTRSSSPTASRATSSGGCSRSRASPATSPPAWRSGSRRASGSRPATAFRSDLAIEVAQLLRRPARWIEPAATVQDAARVMRDEQITSVLVRERSPGHRDRPRPAQPRPRRRARPRDAGGAHRLVAAPHGPATHAGLRRLALVPRRRASTTSPWSGRARSRACSPRATSCATPRRGRWRCSATSSASPGARRSPGYAAQVAAMASALVAGGLDAVAIAGFVARINDVLTHRLLRWAEADLGEPPAPYAWLVFGSEGRMEQTLLTDQDNALVYADEGAGTGAPGSRRSPSASTRTSRPRGSRRAPGGHMARNEHGTISEWRKRLDACVDEPRPHDAELYFDLRRVGGRLDVSPLEAPIARAARQRHAAPPPRPRGARVQPAGRPRPPAQGRRLGGGPEAPRPHPPRLPRARPRARGGLARAQHARADRGGAAGAGSSARRRPRGSSEAFRFLLALRLRVQLRTMEGGGAPTNQVSLALLSPGRAEPAPGGVSRHQGLAGDRGAALPGRGSLIRRCAGVSSAEVRAIDPIAWLRAMPPFNAVPQELFDAGGARGGRRVLPGGHGARAGRRRAAPRTSTSSARGRPGSSAAARPSRSSRRARPSATPRSSPARRRST